MPSGDKPSKRQPGAQRQGKPGSPRPPKPSGSRKPGGPGKPSSSGRPPQRGGRDDVRHERAEAGPKNWGSLGRRGAGKLSETRDDARDIIGNTGPDTRPDPGNEVVSWERVDDDVRDQAKRAVGRGGTKPGSRSGGAAGSRGAPAKGGARRERPKGPAGTERNSDRSTDAAGPNRSTRRGRAPRNASSGTGGAAAKDELVRALGATKGARANERLRDAAHAFERERYEEARKLLKPVAVSAPQAASVRELLGLTYYRLGKWSDAVRELEAFRELTRSTEQHPVLADSQRALKRHREVEALWDELKEASPAPDLVTEGRIVMAGSLADQGRLGEAAELLERAHRGVKNPKTHHLRQAYALADIYDRAGELARARELFAWVCALEPGFADAAERAGSLA